MSETTHQKLHPLLVRAVVQALHSIFIGERNADKVIETVLRSNPKAGSRDRAFIAETTYDIVRYYRLYTEILGYPPKNEGDFWKIVGIHLLSDQNKNTELPLWKEFSQLQPKQIIQQGAKLRGIRKFRESIPDWMDERGATELGAVWEDTLPWLNKTAAVVIRANTLKISRVDLQKLLETENIAADPVGSGDALKLQRRQNIFQSAAFKKGFFEVQDYSSQLVAALLAPEPGMRVVDACAGAGGKTLHLAAIMQNKGSLIALDTFAWKLDELRTRAKRAGVGNIETRPIENRKVIKRLYDSADRLLLDVPCSGMGILRRNPDSKWKLTPESIEQLRTTQQEILQAYSPILKPGGRMVYATCSILPSENQDQVATFLASPAGKDFQLISEKRILPQDEGFDGFYIALLEKAK